MIGDGRVGSCDREFLGKPQFLSRHRAPKTKNLSTALCRPVQKKSMQRKKTENAPEEQSMKTERNPLESGEKIGIRGIIYNNSAVFSPTGATACRLLKRDSLCAKVPEV